MVLPLGLYSGEKVSLTVIFNISLKHTTIRESHLPSKCTQAGTGHTDHTCCLVSRVYDSCPGMSGK